MPDESLREQEIGAGSRYEAFRSEVSELATTMRRDSRFGSEEATLDQSIRSLGQAIAHYFDRGSDIINRILDAHAQSQLNDAETTSLLLTVVRTIHNNTPMGVAQGREATRSPGIAKGRGSRGHI
jgi:hypothetical protein